MSDVKVSGLFARVAPLDEDCVPTLKYVVLYARFKDWWIFVRHRERDTWETPGGHIDPGETPLEAARRELFEEAGVKNAELTPIVDYWAGDAEGSSWGRVFFARVNTLDEIPSNFEMAERLLSQELPEKLTYPFILKKLFHPIQDICEEMGLI